MQNVKKVVSLFSGCGGLDIGLEGGFPLLKSLINTNIYPEWLENQIDDRWVLLPETRFETIFANDIKPFAKTAWENYFDKRNVFRLDSIVDLVKKHWAGETVFPYADIVTGGFPCQDFSTSGKRLGFDSHKAHHGGSIENDHGIPTEESRGMLYVWMKNTIEIVQPKVFIAENVRGLTNLKDVKKIIQNDFRSIGGGGYFVFEAPILYAPDYGIPQMRERVIFIGLKKDALYPQVLSALEKNPNDSRYNPYPQKTHTADGSSSPLVPYVTVAQALAGLEEPAYSKDLSQISYAKNKYYNNYCQGSTEVNLDGLAWTIRSEHHGNIEFRRLSEAHGGKHTDELEAGLKERRLTVRECARLQTFPDSYPFVIQAKKEKNGNSISASNGYRLVGNAVPPLLAFHVGWRLRTLWDTLFKEDQH